VRIRSVDRPIKYAEAVRPLKTVKPKFKAQPQVTKTPEGRYTGDKAIDPLERQAWPKGKDFLGKIASLPERRVIWWLLKNGFQPGADFEFQPDYLGGRLIKGGLVADFAVYNILPGETVIWEVQGTTWHEAGWKEYRDEARKGTLLNIEGVAYLINLKESDIIRSDDSRNSVCEDAMRLLEWK
jgi:hypothetical protein